MARLRACVAHHAIWSLALFRAGHIRAIALLAPVDIHALAAQIQATPWQIIFPALLSSLCRYLPCRI